MPKFALSFPASSLASLFAFAEDPLVLSGSMVSTHSHGVRSIPSFSVKLLNSSSETSLPGSLVYQLVVGWSDVLSEITAAASPECHLYDLLVLDFLRQCRSNQPGFEQLDRHQVPLRSRLLALPLGVYM